MPGEGEDFLLHVSECWRPCSCISAAHPASMKGREVANSMSSPVLKVILASEVISAQFHFGLKTRSSRLRLSYNDVHPKLPNLPFYKEKPQILTYIKYTDFKLNKISITLYRPNKTCW